jgi:hypothetical protein
VIAVGAVQDAMAIQPKQKAVQEHATVAVKAPDMYLSANEANRNNPQAFELICFTPVPHPAARGRFIFRHKYEIIVLLY